MRKGNKGHMGDVHFSTSEATQQTHSRQWARMAFIGVSDTVRVPSHVRMVCLTAISKPFHDVVYGVVDLLSCIGFERFKILIHPIVLD